MSKTKKHSRLFVLLRQSFGAHEKKKGKLSIGKYPIGLGILQLHPKSYFGTTQHFKRQSAIWPLR